MKRIKEEDYSKLDDKFVKKDNQPETTHEWFMDRLRKKQRMIRSSAMYPHHSKYKSE